jgi:hypothetical protein
MKRVYLVKKLLYLISRKSCKRASFRHHSCSLYVAYALLQNTLMVFKHAVMLFFLTAEGQQRRCLVFHFLALLTDLVLPPSHTVRPSCVHLVWDLWAWYVCNYTCVERKCCLFSVSKTVEVIFVAETCVFTPGTNKI